MNVTRGIGTNYGENKVTVMVEESDLLQLLAERGADDPACECDLVAKVLQF